MSQNNSREQARGVLRDILGLPHATDGEPRPQDHEDFYSLGGNSLMAVLALENLRELGHMIELETFYETGIIGEILDSLSQSAEHSLHSKHSSEDDAAWDAFEHNIQLTEWTEEEAIQPNSPLPSINEVAQVLIDSFFEKEAFGNAIHLNKEDLSHITMTIMQGNTDGIVLIATRQTSNACVGQKPTVLGVLLSRPVDGMPDLSNLPGSSKLQRFLDLCYNIGPTHSNNSRALSVMMIGVVSAVEDGTMQPNQWSRMSLKLLVKMETKILQLAKEKGFTEIEALNTSVATKEVCRQLGYQILKKTRLQEFATAENITLDPMYADHESHYMSKQLNE